MHMNNKQIVVLGLCVIAIVLIVIFTPRYKITWLDSKNYVLTEQTSALFKRSAGKAKLHWDKIALYAGLTLIAGGVALLLLRDKDE